MKILTVLHSGLKPATHALPHKVTLRMNKLPQHATNVGPARPTAEQSAQCGGHFSPRSVARWKNAMRPLTPDCTGPYCLFSDSQYRAGYVNSPFAPYVQARVARYNYLSHGYRILMRSGVNRAIRAVPSEALEDLVVNRNDVRESQVGIAIDANPLGSPDRSLILH
jgi:hypothetical protein